MLPYGYQTIGTMELDATIKSFSRNLMLEAMSVARCQPEEKMVSRRFHTILTTCRRNWSQRRVSDVQDHTLTKTT